VERRFHVWRAGAQVVIAKVPFPITSPSDAANAVLRCVTPRTRLVMLCHVTSPTAIVMPIEPLVREIQSRGIDVLIDGAHAPGMVPVNLDQLGAAYYTANCHKWLCAPKGAGFLHVRPDRQHLIHPTAISHGINSPRTDRSRFQLEFDWTGTQDFTPYLCIGASIRTMAALLPAGWPEIMRINRDRALRARATLCRALGLEPAAPDEMIGSIASVALPDAPGQPPDYAQSRHHDPLQDRLVREHHVQVPIFPWPRWPRRWVRISAQLYNTDEQYAHLAQALRSALALR
jgi:isopenicillin-N epimerase